MKINILNDYEFAHKRHKQKYAAVSPENSVRIKADKSGINNDRGYNVNFSGSTQSESVTAAKGFMGKLMNTRAFNWLTGFAGAHNVAAAALVALFLAGGLRPAITVSLPGKKDLEDKIYAAGHSMASGVIGFGFSTLITTPIDSGVKYIYEDAKKISRADYQKLSTEELAEYIRKNNLSPEDIAQKMKNEKLSEEFIINSLKDSAGNNLKSDKIAEFVKANNGEIMPIRELFVTKNGKTSYLGLKFIADHVDKINELKHQLHLEKDLVKKGKLLGEIRNIENWVKAADTTMKNVSDWAIAIPRAMLTIALIPPILKYVFHVEKKKKAEPQPQLQANNQVKIDSAMFNEKSKVFKSFVGGNK
jgi:hypothetical protein